MKTTLKDIAETTGYSISTVSRVLNGSGKISTQVQNEVLRCAERLKYPLSKINNSVNANSHKHIALLITGYHVGEFYASFFHGFNKAAIHNDVQLYLMSIEKPKKETKDIVRELSKQYYHGVILFAPEFNREDYEDLQKKLPPLFPIISNGLIENPVFSTITFDHYSGGHLAAAHFNQRNYSKVGVIKGPLYKTESRFRYNGFRDYVTQSNAMELIWEFDGDFNYESGIKAFEDFKRLKEKPRAIFSSNDHMGKAFMDTARYDGYTFPDDIALVGFDDLPMCGEGHPTISSIKTDFEKLGSATISDLIDKMLNPAPQKGILSMVPVTLIQRESS